MAQNKSLTEIIATLLVKQVMLDAAVDEHEEKIQLVKLAGKEGAKEMEIQVHFESPMDRIPMYTTKVVEAAAETTNISFERMMNHIKIYHELMSTIFEERTEIKENNDED